MWKSLGKKSKHNGGFTLIELVVVIAILGILVAIAVPKMSGSRKKAAINAHNANVRTLESAANMYIADEGVPSTEQTWSDLSGDALKYLQEWPAAPNGTGVVAVDGVAYTVTIGTDGTVTVAPEKIK